MSRSDAGCNIQEMQSSCTSKWPTALPRKAAHELRRSPATKLKQHAEDLGTLSLLHFNLLFVQDRAEMPGLT